MAEPAYRRVVAITLVLASLFLPAACGGDDSSDEPDSDEPIVLGAAIALSGLAEPFDTPPTIGAELAIEDINEEGGVLGRELRLIKTDFKSDPAQGADAALQAIDQGAEILIASCDFDFGSPGAKAATDKGILAMSLCASSPLFGPAGISPLAFTAGTAANVQSAAAAEWAYNEQDWRSTYLLKDTSISFTGGWVDDFNTRWSELAGEDSIAGSETFQNTDPSFATQVTRLKAAADEIDFITLCSYPPGGATLVREIRAAGIDLPILACLAMGGTYWLNTVPNLTDFYTAEHGASHKAAPDTDEEVNELLDRYIAKAGSEPPGSSYINGYSMIQLIAKAIEEAGSTDGEELATALEEFDEEPTIAGPTSFSEEIHIRANPVPYAILGIRDGKPIFVTRVTPEKVPDIEF